MEARKKRLREEYKLQGRQAGIVRVTNRSSGRVLLEATLDVRGALNRHRFLLGEMHSHRNAGLQADYDRLGPEAFTFEVVETVLESTNADEVERELDKLEGRYATGLDWANSYNRPGTLRYPARSLSRRKGRGSPA